jgi:hypothetical protein
MFAKPKREAVMFKFMQLFAQGPPISRKELRDEVLERYEAIGRKIAQRYVRGNVNIKAGRFFTKRDIEERKKEKIES